MKLSDKTITKRMFEYYFTILILFITFWSCGIIAVITDSNGWYFVTALSVIALFIAIFDKERDGK